jgi:hypothetical protein
MNVNSSLLSTDAIVFSTIGMQYNYSVWILSTFFHNSRTNITTFFVHDFETVTAPEEFLWFSSNSQTRHCFIIRVDISLYFIVLIRDAKWRSLNNLPTKKIRTHCRREVCKESQ